MNKKFLLALSFFVLMGGVNTSANEMGFQLPLEVRIIDPKPGTPGGMKTPVPIPEVDIEDYTLTFDDSCLGCELRLVDENDNVVYTTTITSNTLVLPSTLSGEYELQIISGIYCFYGYIEL
jgi:hypothetical protein